MNDTVALLQQLARERGVWWLRLLRGDQLARLGRAAGQRDPYPIYRRLRAQGELTRAVGGAPWIATGHRVCDWVLRERRLGVRPADAPPAQLDLSMLDRNPPEHTRLRRLAPPAFSPKGVGSWRPRIERVTHRLLDQAQRRGSFDLMRDVAAPLPIAVITDLLGIPDVDSAEFARFGTVVGGALDGITSLRQARALRIAEERMQRLLQRAIRARRAEPGDDVISQLLAADAGLAEAELRSLVHLLLIAGFETTVNLLGNGTLALLRHPQQWAALCARPELAAAAVEETLRYDAPVQRTSRVALSDVDIDGRTIAAGEWVAVLLGAANHDPAHFVAPERFDLQRPNAHEHLAFSSGIHYCLGAPLARLEGTIAFAALAERLPRLRLAGRPRRRHSSTIHALTQLPVAG